MQTGDPFNANLDGNEVATGSASLDGDSVNVHVDITNLEAGEKVVVRIVVQLICREDLAGRQGNVQSRLGSGGGAQTVPLKLSGGTPPAPPSISVVKNCPPGAANQAGQTIIYKIDITNTGLQTVYIKSGGLVDTRTGTFHPNADGTGALAYPIQLNAGQSISVYFKTTVTNADITADNFNNSITVTAVHDPNVASPLTISESATATCPIFHAAEPDLDITKTADDASVILGDTLGYTITVTNTGDGDATNVGITDNLPTGMTWTESPNKTECAITGDPGTGQQLHCVVPTIVNTTGSFSVHITAQTVASECGEISNTATIDSTQITSGAVTIAVDCPDISIVKIATDGTNEITTADFGDTITYKYTVENTGNVDLTDVKVVDDNGTQGDTGDDQTCVIGDLAAGATDESCSFDHEVTIADAIAGSIYNIAVVTGTPPSGPDVTAQDDATVKIVINPLLSLTVECPRFQSAPRPATRSSSRCTSPTTAMCRSAAWWRHQAMWARSRRYRTSIQAIPKTSPSRPISRRPRCLPAW